MIKDLNAGEAEMWKYVDDTTISEVVDKGQESCIQQSGRRSHKTSKGLRISVKRKEMQRAQD